MSATPGFHPGSLIWGRRWAPDDDRHLMANHEFCLWLPHVDTPKVEADSELREFGQRLLPFLRDQFVYDDLGRWPARDWRHGQRAAYAQHLVEALNVTDPAMFRRLWPAYSASDPALGRHAPAARESRTAAATNRRSNASRGCAR